MLYNSRVSKLLAAESQTFPGVAQLVARVVWDHDAGGSNPSTLTIQVPRYAVRFGALILYSAYFLPENSLLLIVREELTGSLSCRHRLKESGKINLA